jgi:hypothetical protein
MICILLIYVRPCHWTLAVLRKQDVVDTTIPVAVSPYAKQDLMLRSRASERIVYVTKLTAHLTMRTVAKVEIV